MLDSLVTNVFGRRKKEKNVTNNTTNGETSEGFVVLQNEEQSASGGQQLYPRMTTVLTQEMIVGQTTERSGSQLMTSTVVERRMEMTYNSPIDNIPFSGLTLNGHELVDHNSHFVAKCMETIERLDVYLSNESQSQYNFHLENTILSESLLS